MFPGQVHTIAQHLGDGGKRISANRDQLALRKVKFASKWIEVENIILSALNHSAMILDTVSKRGSEEYSLVWLELHSVRETQKGNPILEYIQL